MTNEEKLLTDQIGILTELRNQYILVAPKKFSAFSRAITLMNDELAKRRKSGTNVPEEKTVPPMPEFLKKKPPLGCRPVYVAAMKRIEELAGAIQRQAASDAPDVERIKAWNVEIGAQIRLMEEVRE